MSSQKGILLINLGTPNSPDPKDVKAYLTQFLLDKYVIDYPWLLRQLLVRSIIIPKRYKESAANYSKIWDKEKGSPLLYYGKSLAQKLQHLTQDTYRVALAMRYQSPSIAEALQDLLHHKVEEIVVFPLYPQYAMSCTETAFVEVDKFIQKHAPATKVIKIFDFFDHPAYIDALCEEVAKFDISSYDHILFSYHGVPLRHIRKGDSSGTHCLQSEHCCTKISEVNRFCYKAQCLHTTKAIVQRLRLASGTYSDCFQSRLGKEEWIQPYTSDILAALARQGKKKILVISPAFTADCLETLYEISEEYKHEFVGYGGEILDKVSCVNDSDTWTKGILQIIEANQQQ